MKEKENDLESKKFEPDNGHAARSSDDFAQLSYGEGSSLVAASADDESNGEARPSAECCPPFVYFSALFKQCSEVTVKCGDSIGKWVDSIPGKCKEMGSSCGSDQRSENDDRNAAVEKINQLLGQITENKSLRVDELGAINEQIVDETSVIRVSNANGSSAKAYSATLFSAGTCRDKRSLKLSKISAQISSAQDKLDSSRSLRSEKINKLPAGQMSSRDARFHHDEIEKCDSVVTDAYEEVRRLNYLYIDVLKAEHGAQLLPIKEEQSYANVHAS